MLGDDRRQSAHYAGSNGHTLRLRGRFFRAVLTFSLSSSSGISFASRSWMRRIFFDLHPLSNPRASRTPTASSFESNSAIKYEPLAVFGAAPPDGTTSPP